jgi:hypothetical protein
MTGFSIRAFSAPSSSLMGTKPVRAPPLKTGHAELVPERSARMFATVRHRTVRTKGSSRYFGTMNGSPPGVPGGGITGVTPPPTGGAAMPGSTPAGGQMMPFDCSEWRVPLFRLRLARSHADTPAPEEVQRREGSVGAPEQKRAWPLQVRRLQRSASPRYAWPPSPPRALRAGVPSACGPGPLLPKSSAAGESPLGAFIFVQ